MENDNKYLVQSNLFTKSLYNLEKEIHKNIIYIIQKQINYHDEPRNIITINYEDFLKAKGVQSRNTYNFRTFQENVEELKSIGGAFRNKITKSFVSFNIIDHVEINPDSPESLNIHLAKFGKVFFYKRSLEEYVRENNTLGKIKSYLGYTQIENSVIKLKGFKRKKFFELVSQYKSTGYFKISLLELKMLLGYITIVDKNTNKPLNDAQQQLEFLLFPDQNYQIDDKAKVYSVFERDFLKPAIEAINKDISKDINNLKISNKLKTGRKISHLEFTFNALKKNYTKEEIEALKTFEALGLDKMQIEYLLKRIGYMEMYGRLQKNIKISVDENQKKIYINRLSEDFKNNRIKNIAGFLYSIVFPELRKTSHIEERPS